MPRPHLQKKYTDEQFAELVKQAKSYKDVIIAMGGVPGGTTQLGVRRRIGRLNLDLSHFARSRAPRRELPKASRRRPGIADVPEAQFIEIIPQVKSFNQLGRVLGLSPAGHFSKQVRKRAAKLGLSLEHFQYRGLRTNGGYRRKTESLLQKTERRINYSAGNIKARLVAEGLLENRCIGCGIGPEWQGQPMELALHCKNLDFKDLRIENLEIVCWNCRFQRVYPLYSERGALAAKVRIENQQKRLYAKLLG